MLVYHPAFDIYNCIFRLLQLLNYSKEDELHIEKLRIWDFYLVFPTQVQNISFPADLRTLKEKVFKVKTNPYEELHDPKLIFDRMKSFQLSAIKCLASYGFIEKERLLNNTIKKTDKPVPQVLLSQFTNSTDEVKNVIKLVVNDFVELGLFGNSGLKARTGLIDFKYDPK